MLNFHILWRGIYANARVQSGLWESALALSIHEMKQNDRDFEPHRKVGATLSIALILVGSTRHPWYC